jgi:hypothetical protein
MCRKCDFLGHTCFFHESKNIILTEDIKGVVTWLHQVGENPFPYDDLTRQENGLLRPSFYNFITFVYPRLINQRLIHKKKSKAFLEELTNYILSVSKDFYLSKKSVDQILKNVKVDFNLIKDNLKKQHFSMAIINQGYPISETSIACFKYDNQVYKVVKYLQKRDVLIYKNLYNLLPENLIDIIYIYLNT